MGSVWPPGVGLDIICTRVRVVWDISGGAYFRDRAELQRKSIAV